MSAFKQSFLKTADKDFNPASFEGPSSVDDDACELPQERDGQAARSVDQQSLFHGCQWFVPFANDEFGGTQGQTEPLKQDSFDGEVKCGRRIVSGLPLDAPYCWYHASLAFQTEEDWRKENRSELELRWWLTDLLDLMHVVTDADILPE